MVHPVQKTPQIRSNSMDHVFSRCLPLGRSKTESQPYMDDVCIKVGICSFAHCLLTCRVNLQSDSLKLFPGLGQPQGLFCVGFRVVLGIFRYALNCIEHI